MGYRLRWRTLFESEVQIKLMETLFKALKASKSIAAWKVNIAKRESCELFYVQKQVETNRATDTVDYNVTIYIDKDGKRGQASFAVYPYMDEKEIGKLIEDNVFAASFTLNDYFDLPLPKGEKETVVPSNLSSRPFSEIIGEIGEAIMKANCVKDASLSATEIFLYKTTRRIVNSNGVDSSTTSYECQIETIPNFVKGKEEVELYKAISFGEFNPEELTKEVAETIRLVEDRANAVNMPKVGDIPVILENDETDEFFESFAGDLTYQRAYMHSSLFEVGKPIQDQRSGDPLNIKMVPYAKGALDSRYIDEDGVSLEETSIIEDGIAKKRHGSYRFGFYLGETNPTGILPVLQVPAGSQSVEELKKKPHVRCVRFSGIQIDPFSGFIGGEVRLGYYFDGEKEVPVTGFSIQVDYNKAKNAFLSSKEKVTLPSYDGPKYVLLPDAKIV